MPIKFDRPEHIELEYLRQQEKRPVPFYVLVAGGIAVGKTHVVRDAFKIIKVMDLDDYMAALNYFDYNNREQTGDALKQIGDRISVMMSVKQSLVAMGTASDLYFSINRLLWAKQAGYKTALLYIHCPLEQALAQNRQRRDAGKRAVKPEDEHRIKQTLDGAFNTVSVVANTELIDYYCEIDNSRSV